MDKPGAAVSLEPQTSDHPERSIASSSTLNFEEDAFVSAAQSYHQRSRQTSVSASPNDPSQPKWEEDKDPTRVQTPVQTKDTTDTPRAIIEKEADTAQVTQPEPTEAASKAAPREAFSKTLKYFLLVVFCVAEYLEIFNNSAVVAAIPAISQDLHMTESDAAWIVSSRQLCFAAFMLVSGRVSDVYSSKYSFIIGLGASGFLCLGLGFVQQKIVHFVLRAFVGVASAFTIPSALNLIIKLFPDPVEQARAIALFAVTGAVGNATGYVIGALFVERASWHWIFWFAAIVCIPVSFICIIAIPSEKSIRAHSIHLHKETKVLQGLDTVGLPMFTCAMVLFIVAVTSGATYGWGTATMIATMIVSLSLFAGFFFYETKIPEHQAVLPPSFWSYPNFAVILGSALLPMFWWTSVFITFTEYWDGVLNWSPVNTAVHVLPIGIACLVFAVISTVKTSLNSKYFIIFGQVLAIVGSILLTYSGGVETSKYWHFAFPGFILGSAGNMLVYIHGNIAILANAPPESSGTVGAIFNAASQTGSALGVAIVSSIQTSIREKKGPAGFADFGPRADGIWFLVAALGVDALAMLILYDTKRGFNSIGSKRNVRESLMPSNEKTRAVEAPV